MARSTLWSSVARTSRVVHCLLVNIIGSFHPLESLTRVRSDGVVADGVVAACRSNSSN